MIALKPKVFTYEYSELKDVLHTPCGVSKAFKHTDMQSGKIPTPILKVKALWDTGATGVVISNAVVQKLKLVWSGKTVLFHAGGGGNSVDTYKVCIFLPNKVYFHIEQAIVGNLTGADVLIGMNIISRGDFAITAFKGKTKFSFQVPSTHDIDFRKE
jgi:hypothetical protein